MKNQTSLDFLALASFVFTVYGSPVPKARPRFVRASGKPRPGKPQFHAITPASTLDYEKLVGEAAQAALPGDWWDGQDHESDPEYTVNIQVYRARKMGDLDNFVKSVTDGMSGIVWLDDRSVSVIHAYRFDDKANPRVEVYVQRSMKS